MGDIGGVKHRIVAENHRGRGGVGKRTSMVCAALPVKPTLLVGEGAGSALTVWLGSGCPDRRGKTGPWQSTTMGGLTSVIIDLTVEVLVGADRGGVNSGIGPRGSWR
jgi:hypothetical protein